VLQPKFVGLCMALIRAVIHMPHWEMLLALDFCDTFVTVLTLYTFLWLRVTVGSGCEIT